MTEEMRHDVRLGLDDLTFAEGLEVFYQAYQVMTGHHARIIELPKGFLMESSDPLAKEIARACANGQSCLSERQGAPDVEVRMTFEMAVKIA
jgi:hypothetical protein